MYGECSATCGHGTRRVIRKIRRDVLKTNSGLSGKECEGVSFKIENCTLNPCPLVLGKNFIKTWVVYPVFTVISPLISDLSNVFHF